MIDPGAGRGGSGDAFDRDTFGALRSMLATLLGGAELFSGQLARVPAVAEMGRAVALMRQAVGLNVAATANNARLGVAFVRTAKRSTGVAFALARAGRRRR